MDEEGLSNAIEQCQYYNLGETRDEGDNSSIDDCTGDDKSDQFDASDGNFLSPDMASDEAGEVLMSVLLSNSAAVAALFVTTAKDEATKFKISWPSHGAFKHPVEVSRTRLIEKGRRRKPIAIRHVVVYHKLLLDIS